MPSSIRKFLYNLIRCQEIAGERDSVLEHFNIMDAKIRAQQKEIHDLKCHIQHLASQHPGAYGGITRIGRGF